MPHPSSGGTCNGLGVEEIEANKGFKRVDRFTTKFTKCPNEEACLGAYFDDDIA